MLAGLVGSNVQFSLEGGSVPADAAVIDFQALEAISRPFEVDVHFYTADATFQVDSLLTQALLLVVIGDDGVTRPSMASWTARSSCGFTTSSA